MAVHVVLAEAGGGDVAAFLDGLGDELDALVDGLAERPLPRRRTTAHEGQAGETADGDSAGIAAVAEGPFIRAGVVLPLGEPGEGLVHRLLGLGGHVLRRAGGIELVVLPTGQPRRNRQRRTQGSRRSEKVAARERHGETLRGSGVGFQAALAGIN